MSKPAIINRRDANRMGKAGVWSLYLLLMASFILAPKPVFSSAQRDVIVNTAAFSSNSVKLADTSVSATIVIRTPATLEYLKYAPNSPASEMVNVSTTKYLDDSTGSYVSMPDPVPVGSTSAMDMSNPIPLITAAVYHETEPIFLRLTDGDQNIDPLVAETVVLTLDVNKNGEKETLVLTETGQDTGVFVGYIQSVIGSTTPGSADIDNGKLSVYEDAKILATYEDDQDGITTYEATALVDPFGVVFDTSNGQPVNGATVTLMDMIAGQPAAVFGDDGVSIYPSTVTTGGTATDSSGVVYTFSPGGYRFPFIAPGRYRLDVVPPATHRSPSTVSTADIQNLPGAPFAIVDPGSRGEEFYINPGPAIHIDLPADPILTSLYLTKAAGKNIVSPGDFLQYRVTVENTAAIAINSIQVNDTLPLGFRYRNGSAKMDGLALADPAISGDGRTLAFNIGTLAAGAKIQITYVTEVAVGANMGKASNIVSATGSGSATSNIAKAEVLVREDLFGGKGIVMGRVATGCENHPSPQSSPTEGRGSLNNNDGVAGVRIYLEDGTYAITDKKGMFHFDGIKPGTHVVQLDLVTIPDDYELISCEENDRFAGTPYSQFVDLQGGTMWRADFYLAPKPKKEEPKVEPEIVEIKEEVGIELNSRLANLECEVRNAECKNRVEYEVPVHVGGIPLQNMRLSVTLPDGAAYIKENSRMGDASLPDPEVVDNVLIYRLGDVSANWEGRITFSAEIPSGGNEGEFVTRAMLSFDTEGTKNLLVPGVENVIARASEKEFTSEPDITLHPHFAVLSAELSGGDKAVLDGIIEDLKKVQVRHIYVTGHTDSVRIGKNGRKKYADNYKLSEARANSVGRYLAEGLGLLPSQLTIEGKGPDRPVSSNKTAEGKAINRRVELRIAAGKETTSYELKNMKDRSGLQRVETTALKAVEAPPVEKKEEQQTERHKIQEKDGILSPENGSSLATRISAVRICLSSKLKPRLLLDGKEVSNERIGFTMSEKESDKTIYSYIGIDIGDAGDHLLLLQGIDPFGNVRFEDKAAVTRTGEIGSIRLLSAEGNVADGKTPVRIRLQFLDAYGKIVNASAQLEIKEGNLMPPAKDPTFTPTEKTAFVQVDTDGWATFQPVATSGPYRAVLAYNSATVRVETYVKPEMRDWVLVGLAEGTMGYNTVSGNMESLGASNMDDKYYKDGRLAFFAKGMIKGKWLLTMAYDSDKEGIRKNGSLHGIIDPDKYYMLYGDATQQGYEAASARALYVKIERDGFYALFGDYDTGLTVTELSRYSRNFNGFKSEMKGDRFEFKVFASDTNQAFVKDEIRGDGTSGLYGLSRKNIVINSESVTIETRDRFRSEAITSSQKLTRHIDYSIDYEAGTIYFKSPVYSRDENFNPIYIVVDYESYDPTDMSFNYGGRGAARFMDGKAEVGLSHIHEGRVGGEGNLAGVDARFKLNDKTNIRAEVAATDTDFNGVDSKGSAYLAEVSHRSNRLEGKAYVREQAEDFGLGQQRGSETGTRKLGVDGAYRMDDQTRIRTGVYRQYNLSTDAVRDMAEARVELNDRKYSLNAGFRYAQDTLGNGDINSSAQVITGGSLNALDDRLILKVGHEQSLISRNENSDFPTRTMLGADYKLNDTATLVFAQEFTHGEYEDTETTRIGMRASPWSGGQLSSTVEQQQNEDGIRVFSVTGLKQSWQVTKRWSVDAGLDRSETLRHPGRSHFNTNVPASSGDSDFTAISAGAAYKEEKWSWTGRVETRDSDSEGKIGVFTGANGEIKEGLGLAASVQAFKINYVSGQKKINGNLRFGLAYRPEKTDWIILDRLDYIFDRQNGGEFDFENSRIINNLNANYKVNSKTQLSLQYGAKYVNETIDGDDYSGYTDLSGLEGRYDLTKKWDVGLRGNILHSWDARQYKYGYAPSVGYNFAKNVWVSAGYNITGFRDSDFSKADFTSEGPFIKFRMKFDQKSARDAVKWISGQQ